VQCKKKHEWKRNITSTKRDFCDFCRSSRGVPRLDGARGKKQVWRPHVRTWDLSEANVLYWRLWHFWDFMASPAVIWRSHSDSAPGELCPPCSPRYGELWPPCSPRAFSLWCRKAKAFCERAFELHRQQHGKNKQNIEFSPWKSFCRRLCFWLVDMFWLFLTCKYNNKNIWIIEIVLNHFFAIFKVARPETFETKTETRKNGSRDEPRDRDQVSRLHHWLQHSHCDSTWRGLRTICR